MTGRGGLPPRGLERVGEARAGGQGAVTRRADRQGASALLQEAGSQEASGRTGPLGPQGQVGKPAEALSSSPRDADRSAGPRQTAPVNLHLLCKPTPSAA